MAILSRGGYGVLQRRVHLIRCVHGGADDGDYRVLALAKGFLEAAAGPPVRSSYRAERVLERNNAGL